MNIHPDAPAYPQTITPHGNTVHAEFGEGGLTIRAELAARAPLLPGMDEASLAEEMRYRLNWADALIAALNESEAKT